MTRLQDISETELITRFRTVLPSGERTRVGSGDDCALVGTPEGSVLVTTDVLVENRHFRRMWSAPDQIGARAAAQNLADIAAMGGRTSALVVSMVIPPSTDVDWLVAMVAGFGARAAAAGAGVVGGDISSGTELSIAVTALGRCEGPVVTRAGAQPGDVIAIAGTLGRSGAGFALLEGGHVLPWVQDAGVLGDLAEAVTVFRAPEPPLAAGPLAARSGAHAMMDVSDGLLIDAARIAHDSNVIMELDSSLLLPDVRALEAAAEKCGVTAMDWVLQSGEDHSLLATFRPDAALPTGFRPIGHVGAVVHGGLYGVRLDGVAQTPRGWDHFAGSR
ncbi:MAG: thiamine-phosphate kinase [Actinomycetaceae bacterium]|nr:thiamine-phosphate kinase [Actinomycetaceae bacterium]